MQEFLLFSCYFYKERGVEKGGREKNLCPFGVPRVGAVSNDGR